jgi:Tfp pilus assembly protein PilF
LIENIKLLLSLFTRPVGAMSDILDRGSLLFAASAVLATSFLLQAPLGYLFSFYTPLLILAAAYVPGTLLLTMVLARSGGTGADFRRDYAPLLTCTAMAWAAVTIPLCVAVRIFPLPAFPVLAGAACGYFLFLMFFAVRTVFGTGNPSAAAVVGLSWMPLVAATFLWGPLRSVLGFLASPFILFYAYYYLRNEAGNLGAGMRNRQNFRRSLDAAAVNPHDGEAQYQLGLIYQQRHNLTEAIRRFQAAVAIDPRETDAHFQLGRIAREQGRLKDALESFQTVLDQDEKHHQSEILRELGALYIAARQFEHARGELELYVERRPYDPEGLFYLGQAMTALGRTAEARGFYERSIEAARIAPAYLQRSAAKWSRQAQKQIRGLA